jgi:ABC-2 type transport system permease protein
MREEARLAAAASPSTRASARTISSPTLACHTWRPGFAILPAMRTEWEVARRGYRRYAIYPLATWAGVFTITVFGFMQAYVLLALYQQRNQIGGYDATDTVTYVWLTQAIAATVFLFGWTELAQRIRMGDIATDLGRPANPLRVALAFDLGRAFYHAIFRGIPPFIIGAITFDVTVPTNLIVWVAFLTSLFLAVVVNFCVRFLYNLPAFWLLDYRGPVLVGVTVSLFFSGYIVPVRFFPDWLRTIAHATPFPSIVQLPADVFVGAATGADIIVTLAIQAAWGVLLLGLSYAVLTLGAKRLVVQGG